MNFTAGRISIKSPSGRSCGTSWGKTLEHHFQWRDAEKILIYDDGAPYSFFFEEVTPRGTGICGGIILHGADNLQKAQYSVHT